MTRREPADARGARAAEIVARTRFTDHFLAPARSGDGLCAVCVEPLAGTGPLCLTCTAHDRQARGLGVRAADRVCFAAYSVAGSQSDWDMHRYKTVPGAGNPSWMRTAGLAAYFGLMHRACLDTGRSGPADAVAVVPSLSGRPLPHPLQTLVTYLLPGVPVVPLSAAPLGRVDREPRRAFRPDFFMVDEPEAVRGRHLVLVDDTWVTGSHFQSAAVALSQAGAANVTGLVLARRLRQEWGVNAAFIAERLARPYDTTVCPAGQHVAHPQ